MEHKPLLGSMETLVVTRRLLAKPPEVIPYSVCRMNASLLTHLWEAFDSLLAILLY